jgi:hypothetical protein
MEVRPARRAAMGSGWGCFRVYRLLRIRPRANRACQSRERNPNRMGEEVSKGYSPAPTVAASEAAQSSANYGELIDDTCEQNHN